MPGRVLVARSAACAGRRARIVAASRARARVSRGSSPMSATTHLARVEAAGRDREPDLRPCERDGHGRLARRRPATSPVDALTPEGTSTATTGAPARVDRSISRAASSRGSPWKPVPRSASTITSGSPSSPTPSTTRAPRARPRAAPRARSARRRRCAAAADDHERRASGKRAQHHLGDRAAGALHQLVDVVRRLGRAASPRRCRAARSSCVDDDRDRRGELARVRHRELDRARADAARPTPPSGRRACTPGFGRPRDLDLLPGEARRPSRAPCRPPPCRRSGRRSAAAGSASSRSRRARPR